MSEWQPIETAPKDGKPIRALFNNGKELETFWLVPTPATAGWFPWYYTRSLALTNWMSLPEPPRKD